MVTVEEIKTNLRNTRWVKGQQDALLELLPSCGNLTLLFIQQELDDVDSYLVSDSIINALQSCQNAINDAKKGNTQPLLNILDSAYRDTKFNFGKYAMPALLDYKKSVKPLPLQITEALLNFELNIFKDLPEEELRAIVKENLLFFLKKIDLFMEFKRLFFYKNVYDGVSWGKDYAYNLEHNEELFGKNELVIDKKKCLPQVQNWIKDFATSLPVPVSQRTTFEEVQYLRRSSNASKLSITEQDQLLTIIKLYHWFLDPIVTRQEVEEYELKLEQQTEFVSPDMAPGPSLPPAGFGFKKPMADVAMSKQAPMAPKPLVMPPLKANQVSVQEILKKVSVTAPAAASARPATDVKKAPIGSIEEILKQKQELEHKIDEKIEELKQRTKTN